MSELFIPEQHSEIENLPTKNVVFFGDLHARHELLEKLITELRQEDPRVEIVGVGDVIGKKYGYGNNLRTLQLMKEHSVGSILGNHELAQMVASEHCDDSVRSLAAKVWLDVYEEGILQDFGVKRDDDDDPATLIQRLEDEMFWKDLGRFFRRFPAYYETDSSVAIHGLLKAGVSWSRQKAELDKFMSDVNNEADYSELPWQIECDVREPDDTLVLPEDFHKTLVIGNMELNIGPEERRILGGRLILLGGIQGPNKPLPIYRERTGEVELFS